ncbi:AraC family transcriptional regulator [Rhodocytophaga aerolata]|uniref:AraC family transcriptional regulator n=1 Tax=Rhodocytophaga aerolata TaxID=455078 RepID=A0ABT8RE51_9BACT|nr:AraC family transcriptional regulator [Rhodocytophaga aerolata]MDO1450244.1 AraC family transcriptional regulator [Rhodocytophaga aerolata]
MKLRKTDEHLRKRDYLMKYYEFSLSDLLQENQAYGYLSQTPGGITDNATSIQDFTHNNAYISHYQMTDRSTSNVQIAFVELQVKENNLQICDTDCGPGIKSSFQLSGQVASSVNYINQTLEFKKGHHNLLHTLETGGKHLLRANEKVEIFHVGLPLTTFRRFIDDTEKWGEQTLNRIERQHAFIANQQSLPITTAMLTAMAEVKNCVLKGHVQKLYLEAKITEIMALQLDQILAHNNLYSQQAFISNTDREKLTAVREYILTHFLQDLSIQQLGKQFLLNEFKLKKGFKLLFGKPVFSFIQEQRMQYAKLLLLEKVKNVNEVAEMLGYVNANHFSAAFKKHFNISPSALLYN